MSDPLDWNAKTIAEFRAIRGQSWRALRGAPANPDWYYNLTPLVTARSNAEPRPTRWPSAK